MALIALTLLCVVLIWFLFVYKPKKQAINNLFKAQKFARKLLRLDPTKEAKELLDTIKEAQAILQEKPPALDKEKSMDIEVNEDEESKVDIAVIQPQNDEKKQQSQPQKKVIPIVEKTNRGSQTENELVNQLIEQSMALEKRNRKLEKENKLLKKKLSAAQDASYERKKNKVKGCIYECKLVKEYNSKQKKKYRKRK
eukprot:11805_1